VRVIESKQALTSGGSSGDGVAIVAAGGSPFDIGSDTGGAFVCHPISGDSRIEADYRPSAEAWAHSAAGQFGPITRKVDDVEIVFAQDKAANFKKADANWPKLAETKGK
jgi:hypothetical protein